MKLEIKHTFLADYDTEDIFYPRKVEAVHRVTWNNVNDQNDFGEYWVSRDKENNFYWVKVGSEYIAAASLHRIRKFLYRGISDRCQRITDSYLKNILEIKKDDYCVNIGANIGEVSISLADMGAKVLSLEPDLNVIPALKENARGRKIQIVPYVAWNKNEEVTLFVDTDNGDTSVINENLNESRVLGIKLDTIVDQERVHLILGDAEGAEPEVLEGTRQTLQKTSYVSLRTSAERHGQRTSESCKAILKDTHNIIYQEDERFCTLIGANKDLS